MKLLETQDDYREKRLERANELLKLFSKGQMIFKTTDGETNINFKFLEKPLLFWNQHNHRPEVSLRLIGDDLQKTVEFSGKYPNGEVVKNETGKSYIFLQLALYRHLKMRLSPFKISVDADFTY